MATKFVYTIVRNDLSLEDTLVQVGHSCLLAGAAFNPSPNSYHLVLTVEDEKELISLYYLLLDIGIKVEGFYEPCNAKGEELGWTSITTGPLSLKERDLFKHLSLWRLKTRLDKFKRTWFNTVTRLKTTWQTRKNLLSPKRTQK